VAALGASLEASLQERWDRGTLDVYGDYLQSLGDPRGDLIAIDRQVAATGLTRALADQRHAVIQAWLGGETIGGHAWNPAWFRDGFVDLEIDSFVGRQAPELPAVLASPAGRYLRSLRLKLPYERVASVIELLSRGRHPWLARLEIELSERRLLEAPGEAALAAAMPRLRALALQTCSFRRFRHPAVRRLELRGLPSSELLEAGMPDVTELEVDFDAPWAPVGQRAIDEWARRLEPAHLPALRRLDLSPNEELTMRESRWLGLACDLVAALGGRDRLTHLVLPSLRSSEDAARVRELLAAMPGLVELSFGRRFACFDAYHAELDHPAIVLPPPRPWPPDFRENRYYIRIRFDDGARFELAYPWCIMPMDGKRGPWSSARLFDELAKPVRIAWCELWSVLEQQDPRRTPGTGTVRFPARTLALAMRALIPETRMRGGNARTVGCAEAIHQREIGPDETVELQVELDEHQRDSPL
jgi:hypothetical protein